MVPKAYSPASLGLSSLREMRCIRRSRCRGLIVSSPGFLRNYFEPVHKGRYTAYLLENRLMDGMEHGARPEPGAARADGPLRLGWVGNLRCARSFALLLALADRMGDRIEIHLHGYPARTEIPVFEPEIEKRANMTYHGRYRAPEDLAGIYAALDLVWAGDFMEAGFNSVWLLPNRVYEGGYFCVPAIAPAGTETASWIDARKGGFLIDEPLDETLPALIARLSDDRAAILQRAEALAARPGSDFVQPAGLLSELLDEALAGQGVR